MNVEHVFGFIVKNRLFKTTIDVNLDAITRLPNYFDMGVVRMSDVVIDLSTGKKIKDRHNIHPAVYKKLFVMCDFVDMEQLRHFIDGK